MPATVYLGAPGTGKTHLMRQLVEAITSDPGAPVALIVNHGERPGMASWRDVPGHRVYRTIREWWHDPSRVAIFEGVPGREVAQLAIDVGWSLYVDDECDDIVRDGSWPDNPLREIVKRGRHLTNRAGVVTEVHALIATHRPANLPTDLMGLFDRVYIGRLYSFNDAERIFREGWIMEGEIRNALGVQQRIASLGLGEFLWWPA